MRDYVIRLAAFLVAAVILCCGPTFADTPSPSGETYQGIVFQPDGRPITLSADGRLKLGSNGSIEVGFSLPQPSEAEIPQEMVLLAMETQDKARFRIEILNGGKRIGIAQGSQYKDIPYDFSDGRFYQLGLSTVGSITQVYVNGNHAGEIDVGYGPAADLPLQIGGPADASRPFTGIVDYLRVWDRPLEASDYKRTFAEYGYPADLPDLAPDVLLYSQFTDKQVAAYYPRPAALDDISAAGLSGSDQGKLFVDLIPQNMRLHGFICTGTTKIESFQILVIDTQNNVIRLPVHGKVVDSFTPAKLFTLNDDETLLGFGGATKPQIYQSTDPSGTITARRLQVLTALSFTTSSGRRSDICGDATPYNPASGGTVFEQRFSPGFTFDAVYGYDNGALAGLGAASAFDVKVADATDLWVPKSLPDHAEKVPDTEIVKVGGIVPHGNYPVRPVLKVLQSHRGRSLIVFLPDNVSLRMQIQPDGTYATGGGRQHLAFENENSFLLNNDRYVRVAPYRRLSPGDPNFVPLGATFSLREQVPFYPFSYYGYDISRMDPTNLQHANGQIHPIFKLPDDNSRDYYPYLQADVPYGMLYAADDMQTYTLVATTIKSSQENAATQSQTLGLSVGVPKSFAFGVESEVSKSSKAASDSQKQLVYTQDIETKRGLVLDPAHVELAPDFRQAIVETAQRRRAGPVDYERDVISAFGTHYPNAVTIGTVLRRTVSYSKLAYGELLDKNQSLKVNAEGVVEGVDLKGKYQTQSGFSQAFNSELEQQTERMVKIGDKIDPVPVFMDMRPLDELLSPIFFDDALIYGLIQQELRAAILAHVQARAPQFTFADNWQPYVFSANLDRMVVPTGPPAPPGGIPLPGSDPSIYGEIGFDLLWADPTRPRKIVYTVDSKSAIPIVRPSFVNPATPITVQLPKTPVNFFFTAKELCAGFPNAIAFGGVMNLQSGILSKAPTVTSNAVTYIYPIYLGPSDSESSHKVLFFNDRMLGATIYAKARRVPNADGQFDSFPICQ